MKIQITTGTLKSKLCITCLLILLVLTGTKTAFAQLSSGYFSKVGIGTTTIESSTLLKLYGDGPIIRLTQDNPSSGAAPGIIFQNKPFSYLSFDASTTDTASKSLWLMSKFSFDRAASSELRIFGRSTSTSMLENYLKLSYSPKYGGIIDASANSDQLVSGGYRHVTMMPYGGRVSIGARTPVENILHTRGLPNAATYKFSVDGCAVFRQVMVIGQNDWADFVFAPNYNLPSLDSVQNYITTNNHLPGIPSAKEVEENGLDVVATEVKLLQKIEELTLYIIQMEARLKALESKNK